MEKILVILFLFIFCASSQAQQVQPPAIDTGNDFRNALFSNGKVSIGIEAGLSYYNLAGSEIGYIFAGNKTEYETGFHFGMLINNKIAKKFWLKHELIFNRKIIGVQMADNINGSYGSKVKMDYMELQPANATIHVKGFQIYAGPYISVLLNAVNRRKDENGHFFNDREIFGTPDNDESKSKYLQKFDFGIISGLEYQFPGGLFLGAKYTHGLTDIFQYANSYTLDDSKNNNIKVYNRGFMLSLGYLFN